jgi:hypothetical protein
MGTMENPPPKPDIQAENKSGASRLLKKIDTAVPLMKIPNVDIGFVKYLCALNLKIQDNPYSNQEKIGDSDIRKMKRDYEKMF